METSLINAGICFILTILVPIINGIFCFILNTAIEKLFPNYGLDPEVCNYCNKVLYTIGYIVTMLFLIQAFTI